MIRRAVSTSSGEAGVTAEVTRQVAARSDPSKVRSWPGLPADQADRSPADAPQLPTNGRPSITAPRSAGEPLPRPQYSRRTADPPAPSRTAELPAPPASAPRAARPRPPVSRPAPAGRRGQHRPAGAGQQDVLAVR